MFNDKIVLNEVNSINKVICFILFVSTLVLIEIPWYLLFFDIIFVLLTDEYKYLKRISYVACVVGLITIFFPPLLWINKLLCLILYTGFVLKIVKLEQAKYIVELLFYQFQSSKITSFLLSFLYMIRLMKKNYQRMSMKQKSYGLDNNIHFTMIAMKEAYLDSKRDVKEIILIHKLRFYNMYQTRTNIYHPSWERWDSNYLFLHFLLLILSVTIGR